MEEEIFHKLLSLGIIIGIVFLGSVIAYGFLVTFPENDRETERQRDLIETSSCEDLGEMILNGTFSNLPETARDRYMVEC